MKTKLPKIALFAAFGIILFGILGITGWFIHNEFLLSVIPGGIRIKFNEALCFTLSSVVLVLSYIPQRNKIQERLSVILPAIVSLIALLTLTEYIFSFNIGIDELFFKDDFSITAIYYPGRMSPIAAINFLFIGTGLYLLKKEKKAAYQFYYLFGVAFVSLLVLISFNFISDTPTFIRLAVHAAIGFIILSAAIYFSQPMLQKNISFERKLFTGFAATIILIIVISIFSAFYSGNNVRTFQLIAHTNNVLNEAEQTLSITKDFESGSRGYVITGDSNYLEHFTIAREVVFSHIQKLKELTKDNPLQQARIDSLSLLTDKRINFSLQTVALRNEKGVDAATKLIATRQGKFYMDKIRSLITEIQKEENNLLTRRQRENDKSISSFNRAFFVFLICIFILLSVILFSIRNNIAVRKKSEKQSQESEEQIQTIFNAAPDAVIVIDENGMIIKWNPKAETLFGWNAVEVMGKPLSEIIIPQRYRQAHQKGLKHFLETGEGPVLGTTIEIQAINKNNVEFDVALSISPTIVKDKHIFIGFVRDITERRQVEQQIQKQKQDIQDFIDSMSTLTAKLTTDGKLLLLNKTALHATGLSMEELLNTNFLQGGWWTFDAAVHHRVVEAFKKACSGIPVNYDENIFVFGQVLTINFSLIPIFKAEGGVDYIVAEGRDITPQKKVEESLAKLNNELEQRVKERTEKVYESERKYRHLFENNPMPMWIIDLPSFRFLDVNEAAIMHYGYNRKEFLSMTALDIRPDEEKKLFQQLDRHAQVSASDLNRGIWKHLKKDGTIIYAEVFAHEIFFEGRAARLILSNDVTKKIMAEEKLAQSEKKFRNLIENSTDIISLIDEKFKTIYRSPSAERLTGWTNEERTRIGFVELVHPDERENMKKILKEILGRPGEPIKATYRTRHKDGQYLWLEGMLTNMLHDESIKAIVVNLRDITESKKAQDQLQASENRFRSIIEQFPYPVVTYAADGTYTNANEAWEKMWQYKREDVKGYNIRRDPQMIASGLSVYVKKAFGGEVATSEPYLYDPLLIGYNSSKRWMQMTLYPLKNKEGEILEVILILLDVTVNKEAEEKIRVLNESLEKKVAERTAQLEVANKELEGFSYSVSHDLRAPLRGIIGFTAILEEDYASKLDDEAKRITTIIKDNTVKMGHLIDDLLAFSRMGRQDIIKTNIHTNEMVEEVINELTPENRKADIEWIVQPLPVIKGDINTMRQVWINLISNAIKYSRNKKRPHIEIGVFTYEGQTAFFIKDNGVGFDELYKDKLFKVFQRLHSANEFEGTGVGLALVEKVIVKHGGKVWAEGEVGKGACFYFSLPSSAEDLIRES